MELQIENNNRKGIYKHKATQKQKLPENKAKTKHKIANLTLS